MISPAPVTTEADLRRAARYEGVQLVQRLYETYSIGARLEQRLKGTSAEAPDAITGVPFDMKVIAERVAAFIANNASKLVRVTTYRAIAPTPDLISTDSRDPQALNLTFQEALLYYNLLLKQAGTKSELSFAIPESLEQVVGRPEAFFAQESIRARYQIGNSKHTTIDRGPSAPSSPLAQITGPSVARLPRSDGGAEVSAEQPTEPHPNPLLEAAKKEMNELRLELQQLKNENGSLTDKLRDERNWRMDLASQLETERKQAQNANEAQKRYSSEAEQLVRKLARSDAALTELKSQLHQLREGASQEGTGTLTQSSRGTTPKAPEEGSNRRYHILENQLKTVRAVERDLRDEVTTLRAQLEQAARVTDTLKSDNSHLRRSNGELQTLQQSTDATRVELISTIRDLEARCNSAEHTTLERAQAQGAVLISQVEGLERQLEGMRESREIDQMRIEAMRHKLNAQEFFNLETLQIIQSAAADGRLAELLDPVRVLALLEKLEQAKRDLRMLEGDDAAIGNTEHQHGDKKLPGKKNRERNIQ
jgi:hypothetical protein